MSDTKPPVAVFPDVMPKDVPLEQQKTHAQIPDAFRSNSSDARLVKSTEVKIPDVMPKDVPLDQQKKNIAAPTPLKTALLAFFCVLCSLFSVSTHATTLTFTITNDTAYTTAVGMYVSNGVQNFTFYASTNISPGVSNVISYTNATGVYTTTTNSASWLAGIGYLTPFYLLSNTNGGNLSLVSSNYYARAGIGALAPTASAPASTPSIPPVLYLLGDWVPVIATNAVPNTNQLFANGAGTTRDNSEYVLQGPAFVNGQIFTNLVVSGGHPASYICSQFGGTAGPNYDQYPFWMGPTTNNISPFSTNTTQVLQYDYFSMISLTAYWNNQSAALGSAGAGASPMPAVTFGTNYVTSTNLVFECPLYFGTQYTNGIIYVSTSGNDLLASNMVCPFASCQAAKNFATAGKTVEVLPGWYEDHNIAKNGVNWWFLDGATIAWDDPQTDLNPRSIIDDYAGPIVCNVHGDRIHYTEVAPANWPAMLITNPTSRVNIKFNNADFAAYSASVDTTYLPGTPGYATPTSTGLFQDCLLLVANCAYVSCDVDAVNGWTNAVRTYLNANDQSMGSPSAFGTYVAVTNSDGGFVWGQGETHIKVRSLICTNNGAGGLPPYAFESGNVGTAESHVFFSADYVNGFAYWDDSNTNARTWMNVTFFQGIPGNAALRYYGSAINYYQGMKVSATGAPCFDLGTTTSFSQSLWVTVQKLTQNGNGSWINGIAAAMHTWWNVQYFEDNSGGTMVTPGINIAGGTNDFFGGQAMALNTSPIRIGGGQTTMQAMTLQTAGTNADVMLLGTNNLTMAGNILHSTAMSFSATSNSWVSGGFFADVAPTNIVHLKGTNYMQGTLSQ
jgi:hypothetical protein